MLLDTPKRKQLIKWVSQSKKNQQVPWEQIPRYLNQDCYIYAIWHAFAKEGYVWRFARQKPPISETNRKLQLQWCLDHVNWTDEQWDEICWSDESWTQPGTHKQQQITRKIGLSEVYHPDCVVTRVQRKIGWMLWGCISGKYGKGFCVFWEKEWYAQEIQNL